jgi:hypothetical protein
MFRVEGHAKKANSKTQRESWFAASPYISYIQIYITGASNRNKYQVKVERLARMADVTAICEPTV